MVSFGGGGKGSFGGGDSLEKLLTRGKCRSGMLRKAANSILAFGVWGTEAGEEQKWSRP